MRFNFKIIHFIIFFQPLLLLGQNAAPLADIEKRFERAQIRFSNYEKIHGHFIQTKNEKLHYLTWGNPKNTPLIWLHGSVSTAYEFLPFAEKLTKEGYFIVAVDYYGHGQTNIPKHEVSLYHLADDLKELMDQLKIRKAVFGGWSRGGFAATAFYDAYPERVLGLILEDGGSVATNTYYHKMDAAKLTSRLQDFAGQVMPDTTYSGPFEGYKAFFDPSDPTDQFELLNWIRKDENGSWTMGAGLWKLFNMSTPEESLKNILRPTLSPLFAESMAIIEPKIIYRNLHVPMLILDPVSNDDLFPFESENENLKMIHPNLIIHEIFPNTGHNIHNQKPEQFLEKIILFRKKIKSN